MDFTFDDEQQALRDAVRGLVGKAYGDYEQRRRTSSDEPGFSEKLWSQLAEMGLLGLPFAEEDGGVEAGPVEVGIVAHELGRVLAPEPYLPAVVLAGGLVAAVGTPEPRAELLGPLAEGASILTLAHDEAGSRWAPSASAVTATEDGGSWRLTGVKEPVPHGARADVLVVTAALPDGGTGAFVVAPDADGLTRDGYRSYDGGRAARVALDGTAATPLGEPGQDVTDALSATLDTARIIAGHEALGLMEVALATTTEYLKSRKQFGVTLNTFQALNFRAADMYVSLELTQSLVHWATMVLATGDRERLADAAARAGLQVSRAGRHIGQEAIQLHGGIAMTAEYSVGMYAARLHALEQLLGDGGHHLTKLVAAVDDHGALDPLGR
jgi:alkylation response protein AidB-like acyl-CoA dehydrogenase